jgi:hypothetical protein
MAQVEIRDEASLEAWLKGRPRGDAQIIAFRAAARVFPLWGSAMKEKWALHNFFTSLQTLRALSVMRPMFNTLGTEVYFARYRAFKHATSVADLAKEIAFAPDVTKVKAAKSIVATLGAFLHDQNPNFDFWQVVADSANVHHVTDIAEYFFDGFDEGKLWQAINADANADQSGEDLIHLPLWPDTPPDWFTTADAETRAIWAKDPDTWAFWQRWWDGVIAGKPLPFDLQRDVALIEDEVWQQGPKAVAREIARIEQIHDLRVQLAALTKAMDEEDLSQVAAGAALIHRGHNNPPEMIEAFAIVKASAVDIVQGLDDAREELAKPAPEPGKLQSIGTKIQTAILSALGYCGGLADKFLQEFAGEMGKQAATVVAWIIKGGIGISLLTAFAKSMGAIWPL